jgi:hypothetical protein
MQRAAVGQEGPVDITAYIVHNPKDVPTAEIAGR